MAERVSTQELPSRPEFQALQPGRDVESDLALQTERLKRNRIVRTADQNIAAAADADRGAALRARVIAGKIARPEPRDRRIDSPGERGFRGDAEIDADFADGRDIAVVRHAA